MNEHLRKPLPFVWSWSTLKDFRNCPKRVFEVKIQKNFKDIGSKALTAGNAMHDAMAKRLTTKRILPVEYAEYERLAKWVEQRAEGGQLRVELQLAINRQFQPTGYWDGDAWHRSKIDVLIIKGEHAVIIDWKTGKIETDTQQLACNAACAFAYWPDLKVVTTQYVWLAQWDEEKNFWATTDDHWRLGEARYQQQADDKLIAVNSLATMWDQLLPELRRIEDAYATREFPPNPSGLCKAHCPVVTCGFNGRHAGR